VTEDSAAAVAEQVSGARMDWRGNDGKTADIVVHFTRSVSPEASAQLAEDISENIGCDVVVPDERHEPRVGSVVLTLDPDLILDRVWLCALLDECVRDGGAVGVGVVDASGTIVHAGAVPTVGGLRPFGEGCALGGSRLFETDRHDSGLLAPFAVMVDAPGQGAAAMVETTMVGRFLGAPFAETRVSVEVTVDLHGSIAAVTPDAVLVVGSTGKTDLDVSILEQLVEVSHPVWLVADATELPATRLARGGVFVFDQADWSADALASAFGVCAVLHVDDSTLGDDDAAQQLLRARPGAVWASVGACSAVLGGRVRDLVGETEVKVWVEQVLAMAEPSNPSRIGTVPDREVIPGLVSVIIPVHGHWNLTRSCLNSLRETTSVGLEVIVVDDASPDETADRLAEQDDVVVVSNDRNLGFPAAVNRGIERSTGEFVCVLNNDTEVTSGWLDELLAVLAIEGTSLVGPRSNQVSGLQHVAGSPLLTDTPTAHEWAKEWSGRRRGRSWRTNRLVGFCLVARRSTLVELGGFDEGFGRGNFEDDELCDRILDAGGELRVADGSVVLHHGSATFASLSEDFTATLGFAAQHRGNSKVRRSGAITGIVLSDGDVVSTQNTVWSMLGLTDHIRVVERAGADLSRLYLARGMRLGVEVIASDWQSPAGAEAAFGDLVSERVVMLLSGEVLEVTDWGTARAEIERCEADHAGVRVGSHNEVRVSRFGNNGVGEFGSQCGDALASLRIRQVDQEPQEEQSLQAQEFVESVEAKPTLITAIVLSDGDNDAAGITAASAASIAETVVVLERSPRPERDLSDPLESTPYASRRVDWADRDALVAELGAVSSAWLLVLEAGERVVVDQVGWMADLCWLPMEPVGLRVGDRVEVRLAPTGPGMIDLVGSDADLVSEGIRLVPSTLEHGDIIAARFPELAAASSIRSALAQKPEWSERLTETMELDEQFRVLDQIRTERPVEWDAPTDLVDVGAVVAFDPAASFFGAFEPNAYGRLRDTVTTALDQSHPLVELVVVVPSATALPVFDDARVRVVEHFGIEINDPNQARLAKLANLGSTLVTGQWICLLDVGDRLRFDHVEHLVHVAYADRSEYVHGLAICSEMASPSVEMGSDRQLRCGALGPGLVYGQLRALELRDGAWRIPEFVAANRTARWRVIGVTESAAEAVTCARPVAAVHVESPPIRRSPGASRTETAANGETDNGERLHLGCGPNVLDGWTNIDRDEQYSPDLVHDLSSGLPFPDNSVELIYSEHFFEHLALDEGLGLFAECLRVLRPGARFRVAMPNLAAVVEAYTTNWRDQVWVKDFPELNSAAHMLNFALREWGHQYVYDPEDLVQRLSGLGFVDIEAQAWGESRHSALRNRETRKDSLLIVECAAP